jgi:hypothetical protein
MGDEAEINGLPRNSAGKPASSEGQPSIEARALIEAHQIDALPWVEKGRSMRIQAVRTLDNFWWVAAEDLEMRVRVENANIRPDSRIGRALESLAAQLALKAAPPAPRRRARTIEAEDP